MIIITAKCQIRRCYEPAVLLQLASAIIMARRVSVSDLRQASRGGVQANLVRVLFSINHLLYRGRGVQQQY